MKQRCVALVPLRGGSKGIPKKNIKLIGGRPLCAWVLSAAVQARHIDSVYVSTDSAEIKEVVGNLGLPVEVIDRPAELASDEATTESAMLHFVASVPGIDCLLTIQATSPLLESRHLDEALELFAREGYDSLLSAVRVKRFFWTDDGKPLNYDPSRRPRRQEFAGTLMENGAFYITARSLLERTGCRLGGMIGVYEMPKSTAVEIDDPSDWEVVSRLLEQRMGHSQ